MAHDTSKVKNCCSGRLQYFCTEIRRGKIVESNSGVARLFGTRGEQSKWPPIMEIGNYIEKRPNFNAFDSKI
jgi:hypothetical protein